MLRKSIDCCCNDWKNKLQELWEKYQGVVRSVKAGGTAYYPDGDGQVSMPGILSDIELVDMGTYWNAAIDTEISSISLTDNTSYWTLEVS